MEVQPRTSKMYRIKQAIISITFNFSIREYSVGNEYSVGYAYEPWIQLLIIIKWWEKTAEQ